MKYCGHLSWAIVMITAGMPDLVAAEPAGPIDVGDRKQLFIDGCFFESSEYITLRVHPGEKTGEHTLVSDRPWEDSTLYWLSVLEDG